MTDILEPDIDITVRLPTAPIIAVQPAETPEPAEPTEPAETNAIPMYDITIDMIMWLSETKGVAIDRCYAWIKLKEDDNRFLYDFLIAAYNHREAWIDTTDFEQYITTYEQHNKCSVRFATLRNPIDIHTAKNKLFALKQNSLMLRDERNVQRTEHTNLETHQQNREAAIADLQRLIRERQPAV